MRLRACSIQESEPGGKDHAQTALRRKSRVGHDGFNVCVRYALSDCKGRHRPWCHTAWLLLCHVGGSVLAWYLLAPNELPREAPTDLPVSLLRLGSGRLRREL